MAVRLEKAVKRWIGSSTDAKPIIGVLFDYDGHVVTADDLPVGSTFLEEDVFLADGSQRIARWNGLRWTYPTISPASPQTDALVESIESLLDTIERLRLGMIDAGYCNEVYT